MRMKRWLPAAALATVITLNIAACTLPNSRLGQPPLSTQIIGTQPTIEAAGFGSQGNYLWVTSIVRDVHAGQFVTVSFNLFSADGTILGTEHHTEEGINPNARLIIGTQVEAPKGGTVVRIQPSLGVRSASRQPTFTDVLLGVGSVTLGTNSLNQLTAKAILTNPSQQQVPGARVGIACFDDQSNVIGGGSTFPKILPPGGQIMAASDIIISQQPARCEMTAQPSEF